MNRLLLSVIFVLICSGAIAQAKFTLSGTVKDKQTGETLIGAVVRITERTDIGAATNEYGYYSFSMAGGAYNVVISYAGYQEQSQKITLDKNLKLDVSLDAGSKQLTEVVVNSKAKNENVTSSQMGVDRLDIKEINALPVLFGERDVFKIIQLLPGVKAAGDGQAGFYVRGGAADQNLILLDEAVVYNPSHLLGFFSTFNSDAIKDITLYKGNEPAQYGGRLSSILDVKMNEGNDQTCHVSGGIGLIASKINVEGPIVQDKGSFLFSARRTYADIFLKLSNDPTVNKSTLYFYDLNGKANYKLSEKDRIYLSGYYGKDALGYSDIFGINWGNTTGTLRWNHLFSPSLFSNTSLIYSDYKYNININSGGLNANILSQIQDWNIKEDLEYFINSRNTLRFGLNSIYHTIVPGEFSGNTTASNEANTYSWENALYITDNWKIGSKLALDYGVRLSAFSVLGGANPYYDLDKSYNIIDTIHVGSGSILKTYVYPEPRFSASYVLNEASSFKAAYSRNAQYLHLLSNSTTGNPTDKYVATNNIIKPELADQVSAGYFRNFKENTYEASAETYYKSMQNELDYKDNANILSRDPIEPQLRFGKGRAYGLELFIKKKAGRLTGWVSYTLSRTELQIDGINNNSWYAAKQDRTHDISVVGVYQLSKKWSLSADFVYYTGNAVTFPSGKYEVDHNIVFYYTERNAYRAPAYHRLDLGATCKLKEHKRFSSELSFSLYNAYGHENPYIITFQQDPNDLSKTQAVQVALFKFVPSIAYNFKF